MFNKVNRKEMRKARHTHIRKVITGTGEMPRLVVFKSLKHIAVQVINDVSGKTLASASTYEKEARESLKKTSKASDSVEAAKFVGKLVAERLKSQKIEAVSFDRGGNLYIGRIKALAEAAREAGLKF